jgi:hypothetical protein
VGQGRVRAEDGGDPLRSRGNARVLQDEEALQLLTQHQLAQVSPAHRNPERIELYIVGQASQQVFVKFYNLVLVIKSKGNFQGML